MPAPVAKLAPPPKPKPAPPLDAAGRKRAADAAVRGEKPVLSGWDGSCHACEVYLKPQLNDPGSYEHIASTDPTIEGLSWVVIMRFRAKNALGALVINSLLLTNW